MSDERHKKISEKAYRLWEEEGQPSGRDLDHWVQAERQVGADGAAKGTSAKDVSGKAAPKKTAQKNEGEGNRTATRAYNRKAKEFAEKGPVEKQARKAKADLDGPKGKELRKAEMVGKSHSHGEDPALKS